MVAFSIDNLFKILISIYMDKKAKNSISARNIYYKYLSKQNDVGTLLSEKPIIFKYLLEIMAARSIIEITMNEKLYVTKANYVNYNMMVCAEDSILNDGFIHDELTKYGYNLLNGDCFIDNVLCKDKALQETIKFFFNKKYVFVDENNYTRSMMYNKKVQDEFDVEFLYKSGNDRKKLLFPFDYCFNKIDDRINDEYGCIDREFFYDDYSFADFRCGDSFGTLTDDDLMTFLKRVSINAKIIDDVGNEVIINNLIPAFYEIDDFLDLVANSEIVGKVDSIEELLIHYDTYISGDEDSYLYFSYEDLLTSNDYDYYQYSEIPECCKMKFYNRPFGKAYSDLNEGELKKYDRIVKKLKDMENED